MLPSTIAAVIIGYQEFWGRRHSEPLSEWTPRIPRPKSTISPETFYDSAVQLVIHSEGISWNRLYYYLVAATVLILAWAQIYSQPHRLEGRILFITALLGAAISLWWAPFGNRGRRYLHRFIDYANWLDCEGKGPLSVGRQTSFPLIERWSRSGIIVVAVPLIFGWVFSFMTILSLDQVCRDIPPKPGLGELPKILGLSLENAMVTLGTAVAAIVLSGLSFVVSWLSWRRAKEIRVSSIHTELVAQANTINNAMVRHKVRGPYAVLLNVKDSEVEHFESIGAIYFHHINLLNIVYRNRRYLGKDIEAAYIKWVSEIFVPWMRSDPSLTQLWRLTKQSTDLFGKDFIDWLRIPNLNAHDEERD